MRSLPFVRLVARSPFLIMARVSLIVIRREPVDVELLCRALLALVAEQRVKETTTSQDNVKAIESEDAA